MVKKSELKKKTKKNFVTFNYRNIYLKNKMKKKRRNSNFYTIEILFI